MHCNFSGSRYQATVVGDADIAACPKGDDDEVDDDDDDEDVVTIDCRSGDDDGDNDDVSVQVYYAVVYQSNTLSRALVCECALCIYKLI